MSNTQDLTITIYPPDRASELWQVRAEVFGDWAVHKGHPEESPNKPWHITHVPSGAIAFVAKHRAPAIEAAKRLTQMETPAVVVLDGDGGRPAIEPLPIEWIVNVAKQLAGMRLWASAGQIDILIDYLPEYVAAQRASA